jgi:alpha-glucoside transport system substrate-binding protein
VSLHNEGFGRSLVAVLCAVGLVVSACAPAPQTGRLGGTVQVVGSWSGAEEEAFLAMVAPFEERTGVDVQYSGTRDLNGLLWEGVAKDRPPDVAGLPGPGQMVEFARHGALQDLSGVIDVQAYKQGTVPAFIELGTVDDKLVGVFIKATLKGLIWYNPRIYTLETPQTWTELEQLALLAKRRETKTWCLGLESEATSGWPGTDWIEDIVLRESGPDVYDEWVAGRHPWTSPEIRSAFERYGRVVADGWGGAAQQLATSFADGGNALFSDPPGCLFHHQATFMTEFFRTRAAARADEYDFFPFPEIDPRFARSVTGGGDLFGMFNDTPQARALMQYLVTPEAQSVWVQRGGALSVNLQVTNYPDEVSRRAAEVLTSADRFRFDASDLMPENMNQAFLQAILEYTRKPADLDAILATLDSVRLRAYGTEELMTGPRD